MSKTVLSRGETEDRREDSASPNLRVKKYDRATLLAALESHAAFDQTEETARLGILFFLRHCPTNPYARETLEGHITASAWITDPDGENAVLLHHRKLERWLQPGGHCDGDADVFAAALRETAEETGIVPLTAESAPFHLDMHAIPARGAEPAHIHYDIRFRLTADPAVPLTLSEESFALRWFPVADIANGTVPDTDASVRALARKTQEGRKK